MHGTIFRLLGVLLLAGSTAQAQFTCTTNADGMSVTVTGTLSPAGTLTIPATINGLSVTAIAANAFYSTSIDSMSIPGTVTNIGVGAFSFCLNLTAISVNATNLFYSSVGGVLFDRSKATLIQYPDGLTGSYTIPGTVTTVDANAFDATLYLTSLTIPGSVTNIGAAAIGQCDNLATITVNASNSFYSSVGDVLFDKSAQTLLRFPCATHGSYIISNGVTSIADSAFYLTLLTNVTIPGSVTNIGTGAFGNSSRLTAIMVSPTNSSYSSLGGVLFDVNQSTLIQCPCALNGSYLVPDTVTNIGAEAFEFCNELTNLTISASVAEIGTNALFYCPALTAINVDSANLAYSSVNGVMFDKNVTTLLQFPYAEAGSYTVPNGVTTIGGYSFQNCTKVTNVVVPASVTSIGQWAFDKCSSLVSVTLPDTITNIGPVAFEQCTALRSVTLPAGLTSVAQDTFAGCTSLTNVTIPASVTSIGEEAFFDTVLTSLTIPASVTTIGFEAFGATSRLGRIYFQGNPPSIDSTAFDSSVPTVFYLPGTTGWGAAFAGRPTVLWNPLIQIGDGNFGFTNNQFGFDITGTANIPIVVEASSNLADSVWTPLQSLTLTNGLFYFSEPAQTGVERFYRIGSQ